MNPLTATQDRVLNALKIVKQKNPGVQTVITMPADRTGPNQAPAKFTG